MRIVFVSDTYFPRINGVSVSIKNLKRELERLGHEIFVIAPKYDKHDNEKNVFRFDGIIPPVSREDRFVNPLQEKIIHRTLDTLAPDIIHIHTEFSLGKIAKKYCRKKNIKIITSCHTFFEQYIDGYLPILPASIGKKICVNFTYNFYKDADLIFTPGRSMKNILIQYGINKNNIKVAPNGIPGDFKNGKSTNRNKTAVKLPSLRGKKVLLYVGRVVKEKNIDFLLNAMKKINSTDRDVYLLIVGDGNYKEKLEKRVKNEKIENIIFTGYIKSPCIDAVYRRADIFVFSSKSETQGLVVIEAMMLRKPVVAIGQMGIKDVMDGNNGGFAVDENIDEFIRKLSILLYNKNIYREKSFEAPEYSKRFLISNTVKPVLNCYYDSIENIKVSM